MFQGYLLKAGNGSAIFPHNYIQLDTYKATPKQRRDLNPYEDTNGHLHRNVVEHDRSKITFTTIDIDLPGKMAIQAFFSAVTVDERERKIILTYWEDENNVYDTGYFYRPDLEFSIVTTSSNNIWYNPLEIHLVEY